MAAGPWAMVAVMGAVAHDFTVPLEGRYPYHVAENGQELVHGRSPLRRTRLPLAFLLKRV
jgi:hypothetical protein